MMIQHDDSWPGLTQSSMQAMTRWTRIEDKLFENALVVVPEELPDRWQKIAEQVPGKSPRDVREHYEALVHDLHEIDSGRVETPSYADDSEAAAGWDSTSQISFGSKPRHSDAERKKGTPWSEEEHKLFLLGLHRFGKGDWRSISRNVVVTRTPTQVASHAQKYFLRQSSVKKERKRSSIHDITTVDNNLVPSPADQNWIPPPAVPVQPPPALPQSTMPMQFHDQPLPQSPMQFHDQPLPQSPMQFHDQPLPQSPIQFPDRPLPQSTMFRQFPDQGPSFEYQRIQNFSYPM